MARVKKNRKKKAKIGRYILLAVVLFFLGIKMQPHFTRIAYFNIGSIKVSGVEHFDENAVFARLGVKEGDSILWFDEEDAVSRLSAYPWIKAVSVKTILPGTILVKISERTPAGYLGEGKKLLFDSEGVVMENRLSGNYKLPHLLGMPDTLKTVPPVHLVKYDDFFRAAKGARLDEILGDMSTWKIKNDGENITLSTGEFLISAGGDSFPLRIARLRTVYDKITNQFPDGPKQIDLRFDKRVIVKNNI